VSFCCLNAILVIARFAPDAGSRAHSVVLAVIFALAVLASLFGLAAILQAAVNVLQMLQLRRRR
jgi:hypothetical protein